MRVLLTGARAPVTLDLARRFAAAGHRVYLADSLRCGLACSSKAVRGMACVPAPNAGAAQYVGALLNAIKRWRIDLLVPTCEEVFFIAHGLDRFAGVCRVMTDALDKLVRFHNKWTFSQTAYSPDVRAPETKRLDDVRQLDAFRQDSTSWVFKPVYSRFAAETKIGPTTLSGIVPSPGRPWVAQRRVLGQEYSSYSVAQRGKLLAHAVYRSEYRVGLGSGIYFVPCEKPAIEEFVRVFADRENYTGQIGFDLIEEPGGATWVLEANPRAISGVHLFADCDPLVNALLNETNELVKPSDQSPRMLGAAVAVWGLRDAIRCGTPAKFLRDFWRAREAVLDWSDPMPTLLMPLALAEIVVKSIRRRCALTQAATADIEWNGEPM